MRNVQNRDEVWIYDKQTEESKEEHEEISPACVCVCHCWYRSVFLCRKDLQRDTEEKKLILEKKEIEKKKQTTRI